MPISPHARKKIENIAVSMMPSKEVLYTNEGGTALTRAQAAATWANSFDIELSRVLTSEDDDKTLRLDMRWKWNDEQNHISEMFNTGFFRSFAAFTNTTGNATPTDYYTCANTRTRSIVGSLSAIAAAGVWVVARDEVAEVDEVTDTDGKVTTAYSAPKDVMRIRLADGSVSQAAYTDVYITISLMDMG